MCVCVGVSTAARLSRCVGRCPRLQTPEQVETSQTQDAEPLWGFLRAIDGASPGEQREQRLEEGAPPEPSVTRERLK